MGWGYRKSFSRGGARITFSKRGITTSWGSKHFRITTGVRGTYVTSHFGGFYYRTRLDAPASRRSSPGSPRSPTSSGPAYSPPATDHSGPTTYYSVGDVSGLTDASQADFIEQLNRATKPRWRTQAFAVAVSSLVLAIVAGAGATAGHLVEALAYCAVLFGWARHADNRRRRYVLMFDLDAPAMARWGALRNALLAMGQSSYLRSVKTEERHGDRRRHGGATAAVTSDEASIADGLPPFVLSNIVPVEIRSHDAHYYLFPDRVLTRPWFGWRFAATSYGALDIDYTGVEFTWNTSAVPSDATILRETWLYVRNDGGPDRRFANNMRVPVLALAEFAMTAGTGLRLVVMASRTHAVREAIDVINGYGKASRANDARATSAQHADPRVVAALNVFGLLAVPDAAALRIQYRDLATRSHPDKFVGMPVQLAQMANLRMQEINAAYSVLRGIAPTSSSAPGNGDREVDSRAVSQGDVPADVDRGWIVAVAAALVVLVGGRVLGNVDLVHEPQAVSATPAPVSSAVTITIIGAPEGAKITLDGEPRPSRFMLKQTDEFHTLEVSARGYASYKMMIGANQDATVPVNLSRRKPSHRRRPIPAKPLGVGADEPQADEDEAQSAAPEPEQADQPRTEEPQAPKGTTAAPAATAEPRDSKKWVDPFEGAATK